VLGRPILLLERIELTALAVDELRDCRKLPVLLGLVAVVGSLGSALPVSCILVGSSAGIGAGTVVDLVRVSVPRLLELRGVLELEA